jgi:hypothetical protein
MIQDDEVRHLFQQKLAKQGHYWVTPLRSKYSEVCHRFSEKANTLPDVSGTLRCLIISLLYRNIALTVARF